ncbi:hypothetical protein BU25DRAFT_456991 [Macroventuria anomochaeta]|uniref:Uncharacterized protein n=1 Tax=Macroventuria anomochaeta TaxID=301207 RepID=A0ACB6S4Y4_9PLEO|nr:uncharacterized protein BU25DRAFT_456991 [Macroventuria anomochaeta]KAF2629316.1 hypothetical protein BU25DRAFT_456991 [Macroventuria anomochaeta]
MTNPPWQRLTRDQLATVIGDYYKFLTRFYIPESALKFPPPGGWPNISPETTKGFPRSPIVIDLLRRLPYIDEGDAGTMTTNIHYKSDVVDYSTWEPHQWAEDDQSGALSVQQWVEELEERKRDKPKDEEEEEGYLWYQDEGRDKDADDEENWFDGDDPEDIKLEHMIVIADGYESGGRAIVLDVVKGNIYEDILACSGLKSEMAVEDYFDDLKTKFEKLEMVPVPGLGHHEGTLYGDIEGVPEVHEFDKSFTADDKDAAQQYKKIYQSFGWPGETYRKEEALAAIRAHAQRRSEAEETASS